VEFNQNNSEAIAEGIQKADPIVTVKLYNASKEDKNDIITENFKSKTILNRFSDCQQRIDAFHRKPFGDG